MSEAGKSPRQFSVGLKREIVSRLEAGEAVGKVARETGIARKLLYDWLKAYRRLGAAGLNRKRGPKPGTRRARASSGAAPSSPSSSPDAGPSAAALEEALARAEARIAELNRKRGPKPCGKIGKQQMDIDFFREALWLIDARDLSPRATLSTRSLKK